MLKWLAHSRWGMDPRKLSARIHTASWRNLLMSAISLLCTMDTDRQGKKQAKLQTIISRLTLKRTKEKLRVWLRTSLEKLFWKQPSKALRADSNPQVLTTQTREHVQLLFSSRKTSATFRILEIHELCCSGKQIKKSLLLSSPTITSLHVQMRKTEFCDLVVKSRNLCMMVSLLDLTESGQMMKVRVLLWHEHWVIFKLRKLVLSVNQRSSILSWLGKINSLSSVLMVSGTSCNLQRLLDSWINTSHQYKKRRSTRTTKITRMQRQLQVRLLQSAETDGMRWTRTRKIHLKSVIYHIWNSVVMISPAS